MLLSIFDGYFRFLQCAVELARLQQITVLSRFDEEIEEVEYVHAAREHAKRLGRCACVRCFAFPFP